MGLRSVFRVSFSTGLPSEMATALERQLGTRCAHRGNFTGKRLRSEEAREGAEKPLRGQTQAPACREEGENPPPPGWGRRRQAPRLAPPLT